VAGSDPSGLSTHKAGCVLTCRGLMGDEGRLWRRSIVMPGGLIGVETTVGGMFHVVAGVHTS